MASSFGSRPGGILSLDALLEEQCEALEFDLISLGLRLRSLGSEGFSWRDLKVVVKHLPADSALIRSMHPDTHRWQLDQHLMADMADSLRWLVWARSEDARHGRNRPTPIQRPGVKSDRERIGTAIGIDQMNRFLDWIS
ncbi:DUF5361 domain-containing protein [Nocardia sp. NPDC058519]|uniref:DUF5361 domain-containing protein n=1 Tax=Nocardia sp. NPDC058519 TaxID=3346535 RepID=UPI003658BB33